MSRNTNAMPGRFRVDEDDCTCCGLCAGIAPDHFDEGNGGRTYVTWRQPRTMVEAARCTEALESCPVDAIRDQGVSPEGGTTTV